MPTESRGTRGGIYQRRTNGHSDRNIGNLFVNNKTTRSQKSDYESRAENESRIRIKITHALYLPQIRVLAPEQRIKEGPASI